MKSENFNSNATGIIGVDFMNFVRDAKSTWVELFSNYDDIKIMTYSFGLPFLSNLMRYFKTGEVIVSPSSIRADSAEIFAVQSIVTNYICKEKYLQDRIKEGTFHMYASKNIINHGKVYLLRSSSNNQVRVITGSANASFRAWNGSQLENYIICDDADYYEMLSNEFNALKDSSTDEISEDAKVIKEDGSNISDIPIIKTIKNTQTAIVINDVPSPETDYVFTEVRLSDNIRKILSSARLTSNIKKGGTLITAGTVKNIKKVTDKIIIDRKQRTLKCPDLSIDYDSNYISINDVSVDLKLPLVSPSIQKDAHLIIQYFKGFDSFSGDVSDLKSKAWKVLVHMFVSPFFAKLRYEGSKLDISFRRFPIYLLLYGPSDNGKTALIRTIQKLMLGATPVPLPPSYFSTKQDAMTALEYTVKGCPILIDDINNSRWKYASDITKADRNLVENHLLNHPTFLFTANEINSIRPEVSKRLVVFYVNNRLNKSVATNQESSVNLIRKGMTNSLYIAFLSVMLPKIKDICFNLLSSYNESNNDVDLDIYEIGSAVLLELFKKNKIKVLPEFVNLTWDDFMGDTAVSERSIALLKSMHHLNPEIFIINQKDNELILDLSNLSDKADISKRLYELPADMERREIGNKISLKLDEVEFYTGINLHKQSLTDRISRFFRR